MKKLHVGIIPDGNRRWARKKGILIHEAYRYASEHTLPALLDSFEENNIYACTLWVLSPENFKRPEVEIQSILKLIEMFLEQKKQLFHKNKIRLMTIGSSYRLGESLVKKITNICNETKQYNNHILCCAIDYGGREELVRACEKIRKEFGGKKSYSKKLISEHLDTAYLGDPDLIIRTGGEKRLSGFMLWQSQYSEFYFTDTLFPDFNSLELKKAVNEFYSRNRRFGK